MEAHLGAVYRILRYLKGPPGKGILFKKCENRIIKVFTDGDWAGSAEDRKSISRYCTFVWGNLVTWRSKKQTVVARSSTEAEFRAMAKGYVKDCVKETLGRTLYCSGTTHQNLL